MFVCLIQPSNKKVHCTEEMRCIFFRIDMKHLRLPKVKVRRQQYFETSFLYFFGNKRKLHFISTHKSESIFSLKISSIKMIQFQWTLKLRFCHNYLCWSYIQFNWIKEYEWTKFSCVLRCPSYTSKYSEYWTLCVMWCDFHFRILVFFFLVNSSKIKQNFRFNVNHLFYYSGCNFCGGSHTIQDCPELSKGEHVSWLSILFDTVYLFIENFKILMRKSYTYSLGTAPYYSIIYI